MRVTVAFDPGGARIVDAVRVEDSRRSAPPAGDLQLVDASGRVMLTAAIPDPRIRSVILPEGGGETVILPHALGRFTLPWPEEAVGLRLGDVTIHPTTQPTIQPTTQPTARSSASLGRLVHEGGPSHQRLDLVILGDGYTHEQQGAFGEDVQALVDYLLTLAPYSRYADLLNIWLIESVSSESGVSHVGAPRSTAFGCAYGCGGVDRLVCCDDQDVLGAVDAAVPDADGILVLLNDAEYGGSGGFTYATAYAGGTNAVQVAAHELGHSLVGLWDEYSYGVSGEGEGPNCSADPEGSWDAWIPEVGAYPECSFVELYRPTDNACMMRTLREGYCEVCRERVILAMHEHLPGLIRSTRPDAGQLAPSAERITVSTLGDPTRLTFAWIEDGNVVSSDPTLELKCSGLSGEISLRVTDDTRWVRDDPDGVLVDEAGPWTVHAQTCDFEEEPGGCGCGSVGPTGGGWLLGLGAIAARRRRR